MPALVRCRQAGMQKTTSSEHGRSSPLLLCGKEDLRRPALAAALLSCSSPVLLRGAAALVHLIEETSLLHHWSEKCVQKKFNRNEYNAPSRPLL
jgi:hypothetical protein